ncbi:MAG: sarcosine oxidase subunit gamma [Pseudomonadota bacterium]
MSDTEITALAPMGMITLRGDLETLGRAVEAVTACPLPDRRLSTAAGAHRVLWMSPDELMLLTGYDEAPALAASLTNALAAEFATVAVVSDARAVFDITGPGARQVITSLAPVDLRALAETEVRRTRLAQIPAAFWRTGDGFRLICFRSVAKYAEDVLRNAAGTHPMVQGA